MSSLPPQPIDQEDSDDDGCQGSQWAKRLRCSSCRDDKQMELLEEMRNMIQKQNQKIEYLGEKVSSLTADISRLDGYLQQSPTRIQERFSSSAPRFVNRVLLSDEQWSIPLQLRFMNSCKNDKYSKHKIEADDKTPLKVAIYDHENEIITSEPYSSMRVHFVPIQGDFDNDHKGQWTEEYFRSNIVSGRPGKEPLLFGDLYIRLQDGVGTLDTAKFQDNSSFVASKRFKLGVMAADIRISKRIQEGITESFAVKDIRGYSTKKNLHPFPQDPVYKLRRIAKDGDRHKLLERNGIKTVEDFVLSYNQSHEYLRKILGKISDQDWDTVIGHAQKCNILKPGNQEHQVISRSDGSRYFEASSSMQPTCPAPQEQLHVQGKHQQSSSTYKGLSSSVSLEDTPREQVGIQAEEVQISGAGNEAQSVSLVDNSTLEGSSSQQGHSYGHDTEFDYDGCHLFCTTFPHVNIPPSAPEEFFLASSLQGDDFWKDDFPKDNFWNEFISAVPVIEDDGWGGYCSRFEQSGGCTPATGAGTPASEAGSCGNLLPYSRSPVRGPRGQGCSGLSSSPAAGASSSSYWTRPAPSISAADNTSNASAHFTDEE